MYQGVFYIKEDMTPAMRHYKMSGCLKRRGGNNILSSENLVLELHAGEQSGDGVREAKNEEIAETEVKNYQHTDNDFSN